MPKSQKSEMSTPRWKKYLEHRDLVAYIRRKTKYQILLSVLGIYIIFVALFSYFSFKQPEQNIQAKNPEVLVGAVNLLNSQIAYKIDQEVEISLIIQNSSDKFSVKDIYLKTTSPSSAFYLEKISPLGLEDVQNQRYVLNNQIYLEHLAPFQRAEYKLSGKIISKDFDKVDIQAVLSYDNEKDLFLNPIQIKLDR